MCRALSKIWLKQTADPMRHVTCQQTRSRSIPSLNGFSNRGWDWKRDGTAIDPGFVSQRNGTCALTRSSATRCAAVLSVGRSMMAASNQRWWRTSLAVASDLNGPKISQPSSWRSLCTARSAIQSEPTISRRHPSKLLRIVAPLQAFCRIWCHRSNLMLAAHIESR